MTGARRSYRAYYLAFALVLELGFGLEAIGWMRAAECFPISLGDMITIRIYLARDAGNNKYFWVWRAG